MIAFDPAIIAAFRAAGVSSDQILAAIEIYGQEKIKLRRLKDTERQRRYRNTPSSNEDVSVTSVTLVTRDTCDTPPSLSPSSSSPPITPLITTPPISPPTVLCPKQVRTRRKYSERFETFWRSYPTDALMSKSEASKQWEFLSEEDQSKVQSSVEAFKKYCRSKPDYRPVHACRYLSQRRFEGFLPIPKPAIVIRQKPKSLAEQHEEMRNAYSSRNSGSIWDQIENEGGELQDNMPEMLTQEAQQVGQMFVA